MTTHRPMLRWSQDDRQWRADNEPDAPPLPIHPHPFWPGERSYAAEPLCHACEMYREARDYAGKRVHAQVEGGQ